MRALLRLAYDGTDFSGCPVLPAERTVCGVLDVALQRVGERPALVETLSRTDAGVHARGNIGHVVLDRDWTEGALLLALDRHLPPDLRCSAVARVDDLPPVGSKTYTYRLDRSRFGDPALARAAWRPPAGLDERVLEELAAQVAGTRDWSGFRRTGETRDDLVRAVHSAEWAWGERFTIVGAGFPLRLVRSLVGGMVAVASGAATRADWVSALAGQVTSASRQTAPARGLCLEEIRLPGVEWVDQAGAG